MISVSTAIRVSDQKRLSGDEQQLREHVEAREADAQPARELVARPDPERRQHLHDAGDEDHPAPRLQVAEHELRVCDVEVRAVDRGDAADEVHGADDHQHDAREAQPALAAAARTGRRTDRAEPAHRRVLWKSRRSCVAPLLELSPRSSPHGLRHQGCRHHASGVVRTARFPARAGRWLIRLSAGPGVSLPSRRLPARLAARARPLRPSAATRANDARRARMSNLVAIAYPDRETAEQVRRTLFEMQKEHIIELDDMVVVTRRTTARSSSTSPRAWPAPARPAEPSGAASSGSCSSRHWSAWRSARLRAAQPARWPTSASTTSS